MKQVIIYTDGACSGNPGPGGWGAVLKYGAHERELSGGEASTTNNRMELTAVIEALRLLKEPCVVELYSDSRYVIDALEKRWVYGWKQRGWVKSDKKPALNVDLCSSRSMSCTTTGSKATRRTNTTTAAMRWRWQNRISLSEASQILTPAGGKPNAKFFAATCAWQKTLCAERVSSRRRGTERSENPLKKMAKPSF